MVGGVEGVFHEIGRGAKDHVAGGEHGAEKDVDAAGRAAGEQQVARGHGHALLLGQMLGQGGAHLGVAGVRHVAQGEGLIHLAGQFGQALADHGRRRQVRVAEREVADRVFAELFLKLQALLENLANPGPARQILLHLLGDQLHGPPSSEKCIREPSHQTRTVAIW